MATTTAKVVADSIAPHGGRITTLQLRYPRIIHAELLTHRAFSRNASSSRAIPAKKMREMVAADPFIPRVWPQNKPGMQATEDLGPDAATSAEHCWRAALAAALDNHAALEAIGVHKQVLNRLLEPFGMIDVVLTSTNFEHFFQLRDHPAAQPEMQELARAMRRAIAQSSPSEFRHRERDWHLPYLTDAERQDLPIPWAREVSAARCARVSYLRHDGVPSSLEEDRALYHRLVGSIPRHASPCEHQAVPASPSYRSRNFVGWFQFRDLLETVGERFPLIAG